MYSLYVVSIAFLLFQSVSTTCDEKGRCSKHLRYFNGCVENKHYKCNQHLRDFSKCLCTDVEETNARLNQTNVIVKRLKRKLDQQRITNGKLQAMTTRLDRKLYKTEIDIKMMLSKYNVIQSRFDNFGCQTGEFSFYRYPKVPPYPLEKRFKFSPAFEKTPVVLVTARQTDASAKQNLHFQLRGTDVKKDGFLLRVTNHSKGLYGAIAVWMACPRS